MDKLRHFTRWPLVEGYCAEQSYRAGDQVAVCCASRAEAFDVTVTRVGGQRTVVWSAENVRCADHPVPANAATHGCGWPVTFTIPTALEWLSGFYEVEFRAEPPDPAENARATAHAFFVLRSPAGRAGRTLLALSTNTYNAYNQWGGTCMYSGASRLSFRRPIERGYLRRPAAPFETDFDGRIANIAEPSDPTHRRLVDYQLTNHLPLLTDSSGWHNWERRFVRWAERAGFELDMCTNADLHFRPETIEPYNLLLSVGHDEYWSAGMRDTIDEWVESGGNWAIFSGNTSFWQVRYEDDGHTMVCHKGRARIDDPVRHTDEHQLLTSMWSDPMIGRPETGTTGLTFTRGGYHRIGLAEPHGTGAFTVHRPEHWAFAGTGLRRDAELGLGSFIVGYEVDGCAFELDEHGLPRPTHEDGAPIGLEILATAPARLISITDGVCEAPADLWMSLDPPGDLEGVSWVLFGDASPENVARIAQGHAVMACFTNGAGTVFNAGTADWAYGLDTDPVVQQVTANVLTRLLGPVLDQGAPR